MAGAETGPLARNAPARARSAVVLLNMGGPERIESVRPFLRNVFADREIIRLPGGRIGQALLGRLVVASRLRGVEEAYERIGGGSPILRWTRAQVEGLQARLERSHAAPVIAGMAMRYWHPRAAETVEALAARGVDRVVALTLYPHYTRATTGSSVADFRRALAAGSAEAELAVVDRWYDHPGYLDVWADHVDRALASIPEPYRQGTHLVVSAHGLPTRFIERGDPYVEHVRATMEGVLERLAAPPPTTLCFQSRAGPVQWIGPSTTDTIRRLGAEGSRALVVWPISFVSDHIETLEEVGMQLRELATGSGVEEYRVVPALNEDPAFLDVLADLALSALGGAGGGR